MTMAVQPWAAKAPRHNTDIEQLVIGTLLANPDTWDAHADLLTDGLFYDAQNRNAFNAAKNLREQGKEANVVSVANELVKNVADQDRVNVVARVAEYGDHVLFRGDLAQYVDVLKDLQTRRTLVDMGMRLQREANDEAIPVEQLQQEVADTMAELIKTGATNVQSIADVADRFTRDVVEANRNGTRKFGVPTGFAVLDSKGGLQPSDLWVIAADSSQGKTAFAMAVACNAARKGCPVAVYSMEMTAGQLYARMMAGRTYLPSNVLANCALTDEQMERYKFAAEDVRGWPLYFDEQSTSTLDGILSSIRTLAYKQHVKLVFVDYLQILNVNMKNANKEQAMGEAARKFKNLAKQLGICIVLLSQLSRDPANPRPRISRLRDSGQIAEAADVVLLLYRPAVYGTRHKYPDEYADVSTTGTGMIDVAKGRNIGTARFIVGFDAPHVRFYDINQDQLPRQGETAQEVIDPDDEIPF